MAAIPLEALSLQAQGLRFHAVTAGPEDGPLVILLHGFPETSYAWRHQMAPLAEAGFRVLAPDQRGYGGSDKPTSVTAYQLNTLALDVIGLAQALGRQQFSVVGHDWGGIVAWHLAMHHAVHIERAAILNAPHPATLLRYTLRNPLQLFKSAYVGFFQLPLAPEIMLSAGGHQALCWALTRSSRPGTFTPEDIKLYRQAWAQQGALTGMLNWYRALLLPTASKPSVRIPSTLPVRVIWGDRDSALERGLAEEAVNWCDKGEAIHLPPATHWLHHEESEFVNTLLLEFLEAGNGKKKKDRSAKGDAKADTKTAAKAEAELEGHPS
jgi:pimeloyl-ACP methyl ester carboxylesterase